MSETVKLIIEIPVETYEYWKTHRDEYVLAEAIGKGVLIDDVKAEIEKMKLYKGENANPEFEKHNIGLDRYFDKGINKALKILDSIGKGDSE